MILRACKKIHTLTIPPPSKQNKPASAEGKTCVRRKETAGNKRSFAPFPRDF